MDEQEWDLQAYTKFCRNEMNIEMAVSQSKRSRRSPGDMSERDSDEKGQWIVHNSRRRRDYGRVAGARAILAEVV
ncbi:hypothetical protein L5D93_08670 [Paenibacillus thiaminolyticus]|nr:hypothetical protein [Paenibacillus thiaminolyticus]